MRIIAAFVFVCAVVVQTSCTCSTTNERMDYGGAEPVAMWVGNNADQSGAPIEHGGVSLRATVPISARLQVEAPSGATSEPYILRYSVGVSQTDRTYGFTFQMLSPGNMSDLIETPDTSPMTLPAGDNEITYTIMIKPGANGDLEVTMNLEEPGTFEYHRYTLILEIRP